jgi:hypothetical protein
MAQTGITTCCRSLQHVTLQFNPHSKYQRNTRNIKQRYVPTDAHENSCPARHLNTNIHDTLKPRKGYDPIEKLKAAPVAKKPTGKGVGVFLLDFSPK